MRTILLLDSLLSLLLLPLLPLGGSHSWQCDDGPVDGDVGGPPLPGQEAGLAGTGRVVRLETVQV